MRGRLLVASAVLAFGAFGFSGLASAGTGGTVNAWGSVGSGTGPTHSNGLTPTPVSGLGGVAAIDASNSNSYVIVGGGAVEAWGYGTDGELGNGTRRNSFTTPVSVSFPTGTTVTSIADAEDAGFTTDSSGNAYSWGENQDGDLCLPGSANKTSPQLVSGLPPVIGVAGGAQHVAWLTAAGTVYTCGENNHGQLGDGNTTNSDTPQLVSGLSGVVSISAGWGDVAALTSTGRLYTWGYNGQGAVGNGTTADATTPQLVSGGLPFSSVYVGGSTAPNTHMLAITAGGVPEAWGDNSYGELGLGVISNRALIPTVITPPAGVTYVSVMAGGPESGAIDSTGNVWMWGGNSSGEVGNGRSSGKVLTPVDVGSGATLLSGTAANVIVS